MSDMSRTEAISILKKLKLDAEDYGKELDFVKQAVEALQLAIASLETDEAYQLEYERTTKNDLGVSSGLKNVGSIIDWNNCHTPEQLDSIATTKNDLGVDAISRADARSLICKIDIKHQTFGMSRKAFKDLYNGMDELPSVTPQEPKTGHWNEIPKYKDIAWRCSECEHFTTMKHNYCPNCGCRMVEPQESEG